MAAEVCRVFLGMVKDTAPEAEIWSNETEFLVVQGLNISKSNDSNEHSHEYETACVSVTETETECVCACV